MGLADLRHGGGAARSLRLGGGNNEGLIAALLIRPLTCRRSTGPCG
jgi:hypothetical protein